jgi:hypothetical protein
MRKPRVAGFGIWGGHLAWRAALASLVPTVSRGTVGTSDSATAGRTADARDTMIWMGRQRRCLIPPSRTVSYPREAGTPAAVCLGWSLVLPEDCVDAMGPDVTRFLKRLCSETRRWSVRNVLTRSKSRPPRAPPSRWPRRHHRELFSDRSAFRSRIFFHEPMERRSPSDDALAAANRERRGIAAFRVC